MDTQQNNISEYIEKLKTAGATDEAVAIILKNKGWSESNIAASLAHFYETKAGIGAAPLEPTRNQGEHARDAFLYLVSFTTLGIWVFAVGGLIFDMISKYFTVATDFSYGYSYAPTIDTGWIAAIIVAFPIYLWVMRTINQDIQKDPEKLHSGVRKWLTYITLFLAAGTVIGDLITLLTYLLRDDFALGFGLKILTVLLLAGGTFYYYWMTIKQSKK